MTREPESDAARRMRLARELASRGGLCPACTHVRRIDSAKGSTFWLCERSKREPEYPRYPPQPRVECDGFES